MVDINRYTNKAQEALMKAQSLATEYGKNVQAVITGSDHYLETNN